MEGSVADSIVYSTRIVNNIKERVGAESQEYM